MHSDIKEGWDNNICMGVCACVPCVDECGWMGVRGVRLCMCVLAFEILAKKYQSSPPLLETDLRRWLIPSWGRG